MISFGMTEEQELVRDTMREFARDELRPHGRECDENSSIPDELLQSVWDLGLTSTQIPAAYGGGDEPRSMVTNAILLEELAHGDPALALAVVAPSQFANAILDQGTEAQKKKYLPLFCTERFHAASLAIVEPGPLSEPLAPRTVAEAKDDGWVLSGSKSFVVLGDRASHFLVVARTEDGVGAFILDRDAEGLTISAPELNMGLKGVSTARLDLERVAVASEDRLGGEAGCDVGAIVNGSRVAQCALLLGLSRAVLEYCIPYSKDRVAFDEPISKKQSIAFRLAEMHMECEAMRNLVWRAASCLEQGRDATREARLARTYVNEKSVWVADNGIQVLGGHGFIREHPVEMWFRHARTLSVVEGAAAL
ncbi:MAG: acyl-CoA dehydrogenase family protein [Myxococcota bacterium]|nr:acyl-CoA dehydrogenase family protein [Myxococcota bacterium]